MFNNASKNSNNWTYKENGQKDIGINRTIGNLKYSQANPVPTPGAANVNSNDNDPSANDAKHRVKNPTTKQSNQTQENQRYKQRTILGGSNMRAPSAKGLIALNLANATVEYGILGAGMYEEYKLNSHLDILEKAINDVQTALSMGDKIIPKKYQNSNDLSSILNVVLQGESNSDNKELYEIGMKIYNDISIASKQAEK